MKNDLLNQILLCGLIIVSMVCTAEAAQEQDLIGVLQSNAGAVEKCAACQQLRICGTAQSVAALAAVLGDERVGHAARYALEGMPYAEASAALRDALGRTSGAIKAGLIDSLGRRRDKAATPLLVPLLRDADATIALAAASALGGIGDQTAAAALVAARDSRNPEVRLAVCEALLRCAEECLRQGSKSEASRIYHEVLEAEPPLALRLAAWRGEVLSDDARRVKLVLEALTGSNEPLRLMAVTLVRETKDEEILKAGRRRWKSLGADAQALVVGILAERGDRAALPEVLEACRSSEPSVRLAGIQALGVLGDATNVALLTERAARASGAAQAAARAGLRV
ncbi:HEAT repeat domain-containing protein, partial [bacterium]